VIHGILHLLGHDHQDLKKKIVMRRAESSLVSRLAERWSVASSALPPCVACSQS
jgi:ssRNA-specific RNase YbeY (16S rRNA maturation enzyme)